MPTPKGSVCHVELFAADLRKSAKFYSDLFGWKVMPSSAGYTAWSDPAGMSGGFTTAGAPLTNSAATIYIKVANIPRELKRIQKAGGVIILEKRTIPGGDWGCYALFRDPAGNNIGLWAAK